MCIDAKQFVNTIHNDLLCPICLGVLCIDCLVDENEHAYCKKCISRWIRKENAKCPLGNEYLDKDKLKPIIRIVKNILSDLEVHCKYMELGCKEIFRHEVYLAHELVCPYRPIKMNTPIKKLPSEKTIHAKDGKIGKILSNEIKKLKADSLCSMYQLNDNEIIVTDIEASSLLLVDVAGNAINEPINPDNLLDDPLSICVNSKNDIYVGDSKQHKVFVFDKNFLYKCDFGDLNILPVPNYMRCDIEQNDELYIAHYSKNLISIWIDHLLVDKIELESPLDIFISKNNLLISSAIKFDLKDGTNELKSITCGLNCIFVICKSTLIVIQTIQLNWLSPGGLYLDNNSNIYTVAYELIDEKYKSEYKFLFIMNKNGDLIKKIELNDLKGITDMVVVENKIIFCVDYNSLRIFEFE